MQDEPTMDSGTTQDPVILIIEDNPGDVRLIKEAFKESSLRATLSFVSDGSAAARFFREVERASGDALPRLIVLDLNLPRKSGFEILKDIKRNDTLKRIPVIVLSSSSNPDDIARAYDLHANCYLTKPVGFDPFLNVVKAVEYFCLTVAPLFHQDTPESLSDSGLAIFSKLSH